MSEMGHVSVPVAKSNVPYSTDLVLILSGGNINIYTYENSRSYIISLAKVSRKKKQEERRARRQRKKVSKLGLPVTRALPTKLLETPRYNRKDNGER